MHSSDRNTRRDRVRVIPDVPDAWAELNRYVNTIEVRVAEARMSYSRTVADNEELLELARPHILLSPECPLTSFSGTLGTGAVGPAAPTDDSD